MGASAWLYLTPYDEGTDSVLAVNGIGDHIGHDEPDTVRRLGDDELLAGLGTTTPSLEQFLRVYKDPASEFPPASQGGAYFTTLYGPDGTPEDLVFWGRSGS